MATGGEGPEAEDTFAKLLRAHATLRGTRPAFRHKDLGLWQTWTWAEVYDETRAIAQGLIGLGLKRGETIAIVGANRPRLYWSMTAAQMIGAVPVPVYADAVADEIAAVLDHSEATIIVAQDQEQVDKILSVRDRLPRLAHLLYDEPRGLDDYDEPRPSRRSTAIAAKGRAALADPARRERARPADRRRRGRRSLGHPLHLRHDRPLEGRGAERRALALRAARDTVAFDRLTDRDEALAYLPLAWVGDHYLNYAQGYVAGFCIACPESAETAANDLREIGPTYHFAPPRVFEALLTRVQIRMEDAGAVKRWLFRAFHGRRQALGRKDRQRRARSLERATGLSPRRSPDLRPAQERARILAHPRRLYRGRGDRRRSLRLLSLDRPQSEAALRPDGGLPVRHRPDRSAPCAPTPSGRPRRTSNLRIAESGEVQFKSPGMFVGYFREDDKTREAMTDDGYVKTGDAGFFEPDGQLKIIDRAKDVGRLERRAAVRSQVHREQAQVLPRHPRGGGDRRRPGFRRGDDQYRTCFGRQLGRAQQRRLRLLPGARRQSAKSTP